MLASLPVFWGGFRVRGLKDLAPSAFLASAYLVRPLVSTILLPSQCQALRLRSRRPFPIGHL